MAAASPFTEGWVDSPGNNHLELQLSAKAMLDEQRNAASGQAGHGSRRNLVPRASLNQNSQH